MSGHGKTKFSGKLRTARLNDLDAINDIETDCFDSDLCWTRDEFAVLLARPKTLSMIFSMAVLPATETTPETVAGYGLARIERDGNGAILSMAILKSFRGQGVGAKILKNLCKGLHKKGATEISLEVEVTNQVALRLYKNFGFVSTAPLPDYYGPGRDGVQMVLKP